MLGMHGTKTSNFGVSRCDLLIAVGTRFSDRILGDAKKFAAQAKILQLDVDPAEINKNVVVTSEVIGDIQRDFEAPDTDAGVHGSQGVEGRDRGAFHEISHELQ